MERTVKTTRRSSKVAGELRNTIARIIQTEVKDPRLSAVTITDAVLSPDLRELNVYYSFLGEASEQAEIEKGLRSASGFLKRQIGQESGRKFVPNIRFFYDSSMVYGQHIETYFKDDHDDQDR